MLLDEYCRVWTCSINNSLPDAIHCHVRYDQSLYLGLDALVTACTLHNMVRGSTQIAIVGFGDVTI